MRHVKQAKRDVVRAVGYCHEQDWGDYEILWEKNKFSQMTIDMPAIVSRTNGKSTLPFRLQATLTGWHLSTPFHRDHINFNIDLTIGRYHYCDDRSSSRLEVEWDSDFDWAKLIRRIHKKLMTLKDQTKRNVAA